MNTQHQNLHTLEEHIIEIENLVRAVQALSHNHGDYAGVEMTLLSLLEQKIALLKAVFYRHWKEGAF